MLWDAVFQRSPAQIRFAKALVRKAGKRVLDVGCATGTLCASLRQSGIDAAGLDINPVFIKTATAKDPSGDYRVGDMKRFRLERRFDLIVCLGTTFAYNLDNSDIRNPLRNFKSHLRPGGIVAIDVLNAIALLGPLPFRAKSEHHFDRVGPGAVATIRHALDLKRQLLTEQVSWKLPGRRLVRDPVESLRLLFPQELAAYLMTAGFRDIRLLDGYQSSSDRFDGRRLIALGRR